MATATAPQRAWAPEWRASNCPGNEVYLVVSELMARNPAEMIVQEIIAGLGADDGDRLNEATYNIWQAAYAIGRAESGIVADLGQPSPERGWETYLRELARRAGVETVAGRVESDGLFHIAAES